MKELPELKKILESGEVYIFPLKIERVTGVDRTGNVYAGLNITEDLLEAFDLKSKESKEGRGSE